MATSTSKISKGAYLFKKVTKEEAWASEDKKVAAATAAGAKIRVIDWQEHGFDEERFRHSIAYKSWNVRYIINDCCPYCEDELDIEDGFSCSSTLNSHCETCDHYFIFKVENEDYEDDRTSEDDA